VTVQSHFANLKIRRIFLKNRQKYIKKSPGSPSSGPVSRAGQHHIVDSHKAGSRICLYFFHLYFAKINGPPEILQNYTSAIVAHGGRGC
jgi:hypothetical protein